MLPLIVGEAKIPDFIEDKIHLDLRTDFFSGIANLVGMVHGLTRFRVSEALETYKPKSAIEVWRMLQAVGFEPYIVLGGDDFDEVLKHGGEAMREGYAVFDPDQVLDSPTVSEHVKGLIRTLG
jgi:hypothetical protein